MYKIAIIDGDGTGPEVVREGLKVLKSAASKYNIKFEFTHFDFGGERYLKTGEILPDSAVDDLRQFHALYLGAIGHPDVYPGILERGILLKIRFDLDLYINLRPIKLYPGVWTPIKNKNPQDIDFVVVRENTEGLYVGRGRFLNHNTPEEIAIQESINTYKGIERCIRYAFEFTEKRNKNKTLTLVAKTNVLNYAHDLWQRVFNKVAKDFPEIIVDYAHVDAMCMWMIKNPERFDVIVTDNMFGDIITDLGAMIQGGMGIAAGGNIHPGKTSMFEPIGGSAPKYTGQNVINPLAAICAAQMMLDFLGEEKAAIAVEKSVMAVVAKMKSMSAGKMGYTTSQIGDMVAEEI